VWTLEQEKSFSDFSYVGLGIESLFPQAL